MPQLSIGQNFAPYGAVQAVTISASSQNFTFTQPTSGNPARDIIFINTGSATCYVKWGNTAQTATTASVPIPAGAIIVYDGGFPPATNIAVIGTGATGILFIAIGMGT